MINLSGYENAVISAIEKGAILHIDIIATTTIGGVFPITNDDIHEDKFCIDRYVQTGNNIEIGTCAAAELTMELNNYSGRFTEKKFEGAELEVKVWLSEIKDSKGNPVKFLLGYFTVDEKPRMLDTVSISALDRMVRFDKPVDDSLTFGTITLYGIVVHCCEKCGVPLDDDSFKANYPLGDRVAISKPEVDNLTYRNLIQYVAQLGLCCAYIGTDGKLKFGFYGDINNTKIPAFQLNTFNMFSHTVDEKMKGVACLTVKSGDKSATAAITESDQSEFVSYSLSINLEDVPLGETSANQEVVDTLFNKKILRRKDSSGITSNHFRFIPFSAQILPYFFLEPLDVIHLDDAKSGDMYRASVAHTTFNLNQNMFIETKSESETQSGYATLSPLTAEEQRIINEIRKTAKDDTNKLRADITNREQLLLDFNKALNSGSALYHNYKTVDEEGKPTGAPFDLYTDAIYDQYSTRFVVVSSAGVGWANYPWKWDSTADLPSVCKYFLSFDGTAVLSNLDSYRIRADLIECDDLQALHATIGGWNIIDNAIYSTYTDSNSGVKYNTYIQTPESTASYATGSYFIGVKNMSTGDYSFAVSPLGEVKAGGLVRSLSGFRCSSDFNGTNTVFEVDLHDTTKMKLYGDATFSGNLSVAEVKATDQIRTISGFRCSKTFGGKNVFETDVSGVSDDEPNIKMRVTGDSDITGFLKASDIWIRTDRGLVSLKQKLGL